MPPPGSKQSSPLADSVLSCDRCYATGWFLPRVPLEGEQQPPDEMFDRTARCPRCNGSGLDSQLCDAVYRLAGPSNDRDR